MTAAELMQKIREYGDAKQNWQYWTDQGQTSRANQFGEDIAKFLKEIEEALTERDAARDACSQACQAVQHALRLDDPTLLKVAGTLVEAAIAREEARRKKLLDTAPSPG
jgi:hypothetical protein